MTIAQRIAIFSLRIFGWKVDLGLPKFKKYVVIGTPHTSNWDFVVALVGAVAVGLKFNWFAKHTIFRGPLGPIFKYFGGIPVNRKIHSSLISKTIEEFNKRDEIVVGIMPEGTRSKVEYWKTGFYHIAVGAKVPIVFAYLDYATKRVGLGDYIIPTGNIEDDIKLIRDFYKNMKGKNPENQSEIRIKT